MKVSVSQIVPQEAATLWARLRSFAQNWHPMVTQMWPEPGNVRAFRVGEEPQLYRERLTWFSESDRALAYTHLKGIAGVSAYDGRLTVSAHPDGAKVVMSAEIRAPDPAREQAIAEGTQAIFEVGLRSLVPTLTPHMLDGSPRLALTVTPDRAGPVCLFLHGIGGARSNWDAQLAGAGTVLSCVAMDLRGYGGSTKGAEQTGLADYFADIERVAALYPGRKLILVGLSYGAWIATAFAVAHPERLAGLVVSGGCTGMSEAPDAVREGFRQAREAPLDQGQTPGDMAEDVLAVICGPGADESTRTALRASMAAIPVATYRDAVRCFTTPPGRFDFARLTCPVLLMTGQHDRLAPPEEIRHVATRIHAAQAQPDTRFEEITGAGHVCNLEAPDRYNAILMAFLMRIAEDTAAGP